MTNWRKKIRIKHLFTEEEDFKSVQKSMNNVADVLEKHFEFKDLIIYLRNIKKGDEVISCCDYANNVLDKVYNVADAENIWIE